VQIHLDGTEKETGKLVSSSISHKQCKNDDNKKLIDNGLRGKLVALHSHGDSVYSERLSDDHCGY
jgi:hypothetical protein